MLGAFGRSLLVGRSVVQQQRCLSTFTANRQHFSPYPASEERSTSEERFSDDFDVVIVGGGPSGLSAAIRLKQLAKDKDLRVALVEKGACIGAHIISGAVMQPNALTELIPDWKEKGAPVSVEAKEDYLFYFTETGKMTIPTWGTPLQNHGNYLISLGQLCAWLGEQAEELGVEVYPSISGTEVLYEDKDGQDTVVGIATGDSGIGKDGKRTAMFTEGMEIRAKCTIFAEGCRGSLTKQLSERLNLRADCQDPTYGIGLKELWEIPAEQHREGLVMHSMGWPAPSDIYGGSFMYHQANNKVAIGYVVGLDYKNPYYNPYKMFQQFKHHPYISQFLEGGTCLKYGARALNEGGLQSLPKLHFPGGALIGDTAGFLNVMKIKGIHNAIKSGMLCAESVFENLEKQEEGDASPIHPASYEDKFKNSWLYQDIWEVRNVRPAFSNFGQVGGVLLSGLSGYLKGNLPFTLSHPEVDHDFGLAKDYKEIEYPKPDGKISFDLLTSVSRSGTNHNEDQPAHLRLRDSSIPVENNLNKLAGPEQRYCPAGVYEFVDDEQKGGKRLQINFSNCVHCKTCDIKDQKQNIDWTPPEGGNGPLYMEM